MRFQMSRSSWAGPLLSVFGGTRTHSWVDVQAEAVEFRFGYFGLTVPRANIVAVEPYEGRVWSWGWRTDFVRRLALLSSTGGVVRLTLKEPQFAWLFFMPVRFCEVLVSLEDVQGFLVATRS